MIRIPSKISPDPIFEATFEIRFETLFPYQAIVGIIFAALHHSEFGDKIENLPITNLPVHIWQMDPNLTYQPHVRISKNNYIVQIGPRMISLSAGKPYPGWKDFYSKINLLLDSLSKTKVMSRIERIGLRYINFFTFNIAEQVKVKLKFDDIEITENAPFSLKFEIIDDDQKLKHVIHYSSQASFNDNPSLNGWLIDIDTIVLDEIIVENKIGELAEKVHTAEKEIFFKKILTESFIESLDPKFS